MDATGNVDKPPTAYRRQECHGFFFSPIFWRDHIVQFSLPSHPIHTKAVGQEVTYSSTTGVATTSFHVSHEGKWRKSKTDKTQVKPLPYFQSSYRNPSEHQFPWEKIHHRCNITRGEKRGGGDKKKKEKKRISEDFAEEYEACFTHHCLPKNSTNCTARERPCLARMQQWLQQGHWCLAPAHLTLWLLWNTEHISNTEKTESSSPELCTERRHYRLQMTEDRQTGMRFTNSMLFSTMHFQCRFWKVFLSTPHIYSWKSPLETT